MDKGRCMREDARGLLDWGCRLSSLLSPGNFDWTRRWMFSGRQRRTLRSAADTPHSIRCVHLAGRPLAFACGAAQGDAHALRAHERSGGRALRWATAIQRNINELKRCDTRRSSPCSGRTFLWCMYCRVWIG